MKFKFILISIVAAFLLMNCTQTQNDPRDLENPTSENSMYPYLESSGDQLYMSWISEEQSISKLNYSSFDGNSWNPPKTIASDSTWFVNWADYPSVTASNTGIIAAHWLNKKVGGPYAYDVNIAFSDDNWNNIVTPHKDGTATEHGFVSMIPWKDDTILAVWLDGRQTANRADDEYYNIDYAMTLRGAVISSSGKILKKFLIDDSVCDCCQTSISRTPNGAIVAYRNRTDDEIRDIYVSRFNGESWSQPEAIHNDNWKIGACPVNGPKIVSEGSNVLLAWFTGADDTSTVKAAFSDNGGGAFSKPVTLSNKKAQGRVDAAIHDDRYYISWMEADKKDDMLKVASVENQKIIRQQTIAQINGSRSSGFPQMEVLNDELIFAWTNVDSAYTQVTTKKLQLPLN